MHVLVDALRCDTKWVGPIEPLWFGSAARQALRCRAHAEPGDVPAGEVAQ